MHARGLALACAALAVPAHCFSARRSINSRRAVPIAPRRAATAAAVAGVPAGGATEEVDVVVIGSGLGGLSAAALLSKYGKEVLCLEAHEHAGGVVSFVTAAFANAGGPHRQSNPAACRTAAHARPTTRPTVSTGARKMAPTR